MKIETEDFKVLSYFMKLLLDNNIIQTKDESYKHSLNFLKRIEKHLESSKVTKDPIKDNILLQANSIVFNRSEERDRDYGPIDLSMEKAGLIASVLTDRETTPEDMCKYMVALKLSRLSHKYKRDTYVDTVGYLGALAAYIENEEK